MIRQSHRNRHWDIVPRIRPVVRPNADIIVVTYPEDYHDIAAKAWSEGARQPIQLSRQNLTLVVNH